MADMYTNTTKLVLEARERRIEALEGQIRYKDSEVEALKDEIALLRDSTDYPRPYSELVEQVQRLEKENGNLKSAIQWMSGSTDFAPGGKAYSGWVKMQREFLSHVAFIAGKELREDGR